MGGVVTFEAVVEIGLEALLTSERVSAGFEIVDNRWEGRGSAVIEVLKIKARHTIKAHR
jgi:hypothetical protein